MDTYKVFVSSSNGYRFFTSVEADSKEQAKEQAKKLIADTNKESQKKGSRVVMTIEDVFLGA